MLVDEQVDQECTRVLTTAFDVGDATTSRAYKEAASALLVHLLVHNAAPALVAQPINILYLSVWALNKESRQGKGHR